MTSRTTWKFQVLSHIQVSRRNMACAPSCRRRKSSYAISRATSERSCFNICISRCCIRCRIRHRRNLPSTSVYPDIERRYRITISQFWLRYRRKNFDIEVTKERLFGASSNIVYRYRSFFFDIEGQNFDIEVTKDPRFGASSISYADVVGFTSTSKKKLRHRSRDIVYDIASDIASDIIHDI